MSTITLPDEIKEIIDIYEEVIFDLGLFISSLGIKDDPIKVAETFYYMYSNGYLSAYKHFEKIYPNSFQKLNDDYMTMDIMGSIIIAGYGVCRHVADFLNHLLSNLGYISSQLFMYDPRLQAVINKPKNTTNFTYYQLQEYIDKALKGFNLFSLDETAFEKRYDGFTVEAKYYPPLSLNESNLINHTINIVLSKISAHQFIYDAHTYIYDAHTHKIGKIIGDSCIKLFEIDRPGVTYKQFARFSFDFPTYYKNQYANPYILGSTLFHDYDTMPIEETLERAVAFIPHVKEFIPAFDNFSALHEEQYRRVHRKYIDLKNRLP